MRCDLTNAHKRNIRYQGIKSNKNVQNITEVISVNKSRIGVKMTFKVVLLVLQ